MYAYAKHIYTYIDEFLVKDSLFHNVLPAIGMWCLFLSKFSLNTESGLGLLKIPSVLFCFVYYIECIIIYQQCLDHFEIVDL